MPHFAQEKTDLFEGFIVKNATELFKCACCFNLEECRWSDLTLVNFSNSFKHFSLLDDELKLLLECYKALYPNKEIELSSSIARKYSNVMLGTEKFGSKMDCRNLRSARVMASWSAGDGTIDTSVPKSPGIVKWGGEQGVCSSPLCELLLCTQCKAQWRILSACICCCVVVQS